MLKLNKKNSMLSNIHDKNRAVKESTIEGMKKWHQEKQ
jgi:hypothetical protein